MKKFLKEVKRLQEQEKRLQQTAQKNSKPQYVLDPNVPIAEEWPDSSINFIWGVTPDIPDHLSPLDVAIANRFHYWSEDYEEVKEYVATYGGNIMPFVRSPEYPDRWQLGLPSNDFEDEEYDLDDLDDFEEDEEYDDED